jgi:hypothetical protein
MLLLKIAKNAFFSQNTITHSYIKHTSHTIKALDFIKEETFSFYAQWLLLF